MLLYIVHVFSVDMQHWQLPRYCDMQVLLLVVAGVRRSFGKLLRVLLGLGLSPSGALC